MLIHPVFSQSLEEVCMYKSQIHKLAITCTIVPHIYLHSFRLLLFSILSDDRSKASSKTIPPYSAIQSLLFQMRVSCPFLKVTQ